MSKPSKLITVDKTTASNGKPKESNKKYKKKLGGATGRGFMPGKSGNPKGRPKKTPSIPDLLQKHGDLIHEETGKKQLDVVMKNVYDLAIDGEKWAVQFIADRTEGRAIERVQTQNLEPIKILDIDGVDDECL